MEQLEKVEKLRQRANVSYEDAKSALEEANWDILEAMVILEKQGKAGGPSQTSWSTSYEGQTQYTSVHEKVQEQQTADKEGFFHKIGRLLKKLIKKSNENYFYVTRHGEEIFKVPVWAFILALLFFWELTLIVMVIALFFGYQYSFRGKDDLSGVNRAMEKASNLADRVKDEYDKL